ncbi:hypothetical protein P8452_25742 [Trifolium repens]|nr:hypothetical protein P8452_25742 [Trifolium repens]
MEDLWDWLIRILRLIYAGFSGLVYAGLDLCSVIKRKVQAALNERMQEYKRQIDRESQGLRGFFVLDSRGMLHYYRRQCRKLSFRCCKVMEQALSCFFFQVNHPDIVKSSMDMNSNIVL